MMLCFFAMLLASGCAEKEETNKKDQLQIARVQGSKIHFTDGSNFETDLYDLKFLDIVSSPGNAHFLLLEGRYCTECDAALSIYFFNTAKPKPTTEYGENRIPYPGELKDAETGTPLEFSRLFYGEVLPDRYGLLIYQKGLAAENGTSARMVLVEIIKDSLQITNFESEAQLEIAVQQLNKGNCKELPGMETFTEP